MRMWKYITGSQKIQPIGMDIGHSSLKMVQLAVCEDGIKVLAARRRLWRWTGPPMTRSGNRL